MSNATNSLIAFYLSEGSDHQGRKIEHVWALPPFWLEHTHDYIQWLFPIPEAGRFNGFAPRLGSKEQAAFAASETLRERQRHSLDIMLGFFGLEREGLVIKPLAELTIQNHIWLKRGGHNHLRISRIIRSLHLCYQPELATAVQQAVIEIGTSHGVVSTESCRHWLAANQPV